MNNKKLDLNKFREMYTPFQGFNKKYLNALDAYSSFFDVILNYSDVGDFNDIFDFIKIDAPTEQNISNPIALKLIEFLIRIHKPQAFLEIGTFVGISTVCFKNALPESSHLTFIERETECYETTMKNLKVCTNNKNITGINKDAIVTLTELNKKRMKYDFIFLDGGKENYCEYMNYIDKILVKGGILVVDDVFFHGDVANRVPLTQKGVGVKMFLEQMKKTNSYKRLILPLSNGIMILIKE